MNHYAKNVILAAALALRLYSTGCVYAPARPHYRAVWVPAHSSGRLGWRTLALIGTRFHILHPAIDAGHGVFYIQPIG